MMNCVANGYKNMFFFNVILCENTYTNLVFASGIPNDLSL